MQLRTALDAARRTGGRLDGWAFIGPRGVVADRLIVPVTIPGRIRGLIGRPALAPDQALVLCPCTQVHTIGLRTPIDVVFCDEGGTVLHVESLRPLRFSRVVRGARWCVELAHGRASGCGLSPGVLAGLVRTA